MLLQVLNRLLTHDEPARTKLAQFSGQWVMFDTQPLTRTAQINERGFLVEGTPTGRADLVIRFPLSAAPLAVLGKERLLREARVEGNIALGNAFNSVLETLPLAMEQETERWVGPVAAHGLAQAGRRAAGALAALHESVSRNTTRALTRGEHSPLPTRAATNAWSYEVNGVAMRVQALEQRVARLAAHACPSVRTP
jgi:ubiquinone biosynthesis accessory factor UbiJ